MSLAIICYCDRFRQKEQECFSSFVPMLFSYGHFVYYHEYGKYVYTLLFYKNSMKEIFYYMDASSTTMTLTHLLIIWTLLSVLLLWICLFTFLALRPEREKIAEEPAPVVTSRTLVTHIAQSQPAVLPPPLTPVHEQVSEAVPLV